MLWKPEYEGFSPCKVLDFSNIPKYFKTYSKINESHISMSLSVLLGKGDLRRRNLSVLPFLSGGRNEGFGNSAGRKPCP